VVKAEPLLAINAGVDVWLHTALIKKIGQFIEDITSRHDDDLQFKNLLL